MKNVPLSIRLEFKKSILFEANSREITDNITIGRAKDCTWQIPIEDALASGLDFVPIVDTGDNTPGVSLPHCSPEFLETLRSSDLVIAKGQGNFESMGEEFHDRPAFYLLRTKCAVICEQLGTSLNSIRILGRNLDR